MKNILNTICLYCIAILLVSCGNHIDKQDVGKKVFKYNEPGGITSLDPAFCRNLENIWAANQIYNGLVQMSPNLKIMPSIAKSWKVSEDGLEYTFNLRDDIYFHDNQAFKDSIGRLVVAQDFVNSFYRITDTKVASPGAYIFNNLDKSEKSKYLGFVAINETTFKIFLKKPYPPFLGLLTMKYCSVVPKEVVDFYGNDFRRNPVGTGPFKFKVWNEGSKLVLVKNDTYFEEENGEKLPYLDAISISFIKDPQVAFLDFIRGNYDFKSGMDPTYKDEILTMEGKLRKKYKSKFKMFKHEWLETIYLGILVDDKTIKKTPLKFRAIRQAINYGFDRVKMVQYLRNNIGVPASQGFIPKGMPGFNAATKGYAYDIEKSKKLLYTAGFPEGKGLPEITLSSTTMYQDLCEYIQHELNDVGFKVKIDVKDEGTFREMVAQNKINFFTKSWIADYPDAENFLALFYSKNFAPSGPNYTHYNNAEYDRLYEKSLNENNDSLRIVLYQQMDAILINDAPIVPLYYNEVVRFVQNNIKGLESNPMNQLSLKKVQKL